MYSQVQLQPSVFSSSGNSATIGNINVSYTIGECIVTTVSNNTSILTQGFHQPLFNRDSSITTGDDSLITIYTGFTPNGDDKNDIWIIDGIDSLENTVSIFNRWGNLIWRADNYDNANVVWDGKGGNGNELPSGTYFYIINLRKGQIRKGWVELIK